MNLTAAYTENVSIQPLLATSALPDNESSSSRRYPVDVIMKLNGALLSPDISFGFDFSAFPSSGNFQTTVSAFQNKVANDEQNKLANLAELDFGLIVRHSDALHNNKTYRESLF
jgi:hypothetical protein